MRSTENKRHFDTNRQSTNSVLLERYIGDENKGPRNLVITNIILDYMKREVFSAFVCTFWCANIFIAGLHSQILCHARPWKDHSQNKQAINSSLQVAVDGYYHKLTSHQNE